MLDYGIAIKKLQLLVGYIYAATGGELTQCGQPCKHRACLHGKTEVEVVGQGLKPVTITHQDWSKLIEEAGKRGGAQLTVYEACCVYYNLCAPSIISSFSLMLWNLWRRLDGTKGCSYEEYWNLPALYVEACDIIESEITTTRKRQQGDVVVTDLLKGKKRR